MVYEDESSNDLLSLDISSSSDGMMYRIPASIDDEDYMGIENSTLDPPQNCGFVGWVHQEWPPTMQNALLKLWEMLEDSKSARRDDNLENSLKIHHLTEEKRNLDANYDKLVEDVNQLLNLAEAQGRVIRTQKANHLKEKEKLTEENCNLKLQVDELKIQIADQLKALEKNQEKLKMIRDISDG
ncbi:hypothetical protein D1007_13340 [Hordeum vulgare]|nr:hypothetical protein D1007_13340 [Hordeum vulgare]